MTACLRSSALLLSIALVSTACGQQWAEKMFTVKTHDFGNVARAAKVEFQFPVKNLYKEDIHLASVRASCGCTTPRIEKEWLKTGEVGYVTAHFNTDTFTGKKGATLTVVIDKPYYAEVQLRVDGYIRTDVVFNPGQIEFGQVDQGSPMTKTVKVAYAGRETWEITRVESNLPFVTVQPRLVGRAPGKVNYELDVTISDEATTGFVQDNLVILTNDQKMPRVPLMMTADIVSAVTATPASLMLGDVKPGEVLERRMVVKGRSPFKITGARCEGFDAEVMGGDEAKEVHAVTVRLTPRADAAGANRGAILIIATDLPGDPQVTTKVMANVVTGG